MPPFCRRQIGIMEVGDRRMASTAGVCGTGGFFLAV